MAPAGDVVELVDGDLFGSAGLHGGHKVGGLLGANLDAFDGGQGNDVLGGRAYANGRRAASRWTS